MDQHSIVKKETKTHDDNSMSDVEVEVVRRHGKAGSRSIKPRRR